MVIRDKDDSACTENVFKSFLLSLSVDLAQKHTQK